MNHELPRKLAVILFADVVGFSSMMHADETGTFLRVRDYLKLFSDEIQQQSGRVVKTSGDAIMADFDSVVHAINCATQIQTCFAERNQDLPESDKIHFRIGINLGEVIVDGDDLYGDGVNIASRLEGLAESGGICITDAVRSALGGKTRFSFRDMGAQQVKNIAAAVHCYQLETGLPDIQLPTTESITNVDYDTDLSTSLSVQLFRFVGQAGDHEFLATAISESVTNALICFREFNVIKDNTNSDFFLSGSIQISGKRVRISPVLSNRDGRKIWSKKIDRDLDDVFELQDEISAIIAAYLGEALWQEGAREAGAKEKRSFSAKDWLYYSMGLIHQLTETDVEEAGIAAEQATKLAPNATYPKMVMGYVLFIQLSQKWIADTEANQQRALQLLEEILRLDSLHPTNHRLASRLYGLLGRQQECVAHADRALELNPFDGDIMVNQSMLLNQAGRATEAIPWINKALRYNPHPPAYYRQVLFSSYYWVGNDSDALDQLNKCEGAFLAQFQYIAIALLWRNGKVKEVSARLARLGKIRPQMSLNDASELFPGYSDRDAVQNLFDELQDAGLRHSAE
ncbi:MAG: adenylate cyclase [Parasphingorhabdus sp.]